MTKVWVIMRGQVGSDAFFAWCEASPDHPGFENIYYTSTDGIHAVDPTGALPPGELPALKELVAVVPFQETYYLSEAQFGERFPDDGSDPGDEPGDGPTAVAPEAPPVAVVGEGVTDGRP